MTTLSIDTAFHLPPGSGGGGQTITVALWRPTREMLESHCTLVQNRQGQFGFPTLQVIADRSGFTLVLQQTDGRPRKLRHADYDWGSAWAALEIPKRSKFRGEAALATLDAVQTRVVQGGLKKKGQRGRSVGGTGGLEEADRRSYLEAALLARGADGYPLGRSARDALGMPAERLPRRFRRRVEELRLDANEMDRKAGERELVKDAANVARDALRAAAKADLDTNDLGQLPTHTKISAKAVPTSKK